MDIQQKNEVFSESYFSVMRTLIIFVIVANALYIVENLLVLTVEDYFVLIGINICLSPLFLLILYLKINTKIPLLEINESGLTVRPTRQDSVISLAWKDIRKINRLRIQAKFFAPHFLIHLFTPDLVISEAPHKLQRKLIRHYKLSSTPLCISMAGFNSEAIDQVTALIEHSSSTKVDVLKSVKRMEYYREIVVANNNTPPTSVTFSKAAKTAKTPREMYVGAFYGLLIAVLILASVIIFTLVFL